MRVRDMRGLNRGVHVIGRGLSTGANVNNSREADVTICGCGLVGASAALHLARKGLKVLAIDQAKPYENQMWEPLGTGSSWMPWQHEQTRRLATVSHDLYRDMLVTHPLINMQNITRVFVASREQSLMSLRRMKALADALGRESEEWTPENVAQHIPMMNVSDVKGAMLFANEYTVAPLHLLKALKEEAVAAGVEILDGYRASKVVVDDNRKVVGLHTSEGFIHTPALVDCTGIWSGLLAVEGHPDLTHVRVPQQPCSYSTMEVRADYSPDQILHDLDGGLMLTPSATDPNHMRVSAVLSNCRRPIFSSSEPPDEEFAYEDMGPDWDAYRPALENLIERFPSFKDASFQRLFRGVESYTPDGYPIVGESSILSGYYLACGLNGHAVSLAGGIGELVANWVNPGVDHLQCDTSLIDVTRFLDVHCNKNYLQQRVPESAGLVFNSLPYGHNYTAGRDVRKSPIYYQQKEAGAVFGEIMGYERPIYFDSSGVKPVNPLVGKPSWFHAVQYEYEACRERVGLIDMSNFSKFDIFSDDDEVVEFLQRLCSVDVDKPVHSTVFTGMQNEMGGYVTDCTLSRLSNNHFFMIAPTVQQVRCKMWMEKHLPAHSRVVIQDVTSMYTALNVIGPSSRQLLEDLAEQSMSPSNFPAFTCHEINVGSASNIRAISVSHCGELGWVLYIPNELAQRVYEDIVEAGKGYGLQQTGYYTLRQLRIEKFYVYWGMDIDWTTTPLQCGRAFRTSMAKNNFIGREALVQEKKEGPKRRYVQLLVDKHSLHVDPWPQGGEPIYGNGKFCGMTTTAGYGYTLGCQVCIGFIDQGHIDVWSDAITSAKYEMDIAGVRFPVRINLNSPILPMISSEHPAHYRPTQ